MTAGTLKQDLKKHKRLKGMLKGQNATCKFLGHENNTAQPKSR